MNKILVITPMYKIIGREHLIRDTECIHDLVKNWTNDNEIHVISTYIRRAKLLPYFFQKEQLKYYIKGYNYTCDNIPVTLIERQKLFPKQTNGFKFDGIRYNKIIKNELRKKDFIPEIIITHIPSSSIFFIKDLFNNIDKIAVLHYTDVKYLNETGQKFINFLTNNYQKIFCRSEAIYNEFKKYNMPNLSNQIIYSGVPNIAINDKIIESKFKKKQIQLLYVGKLIERKKLDILIKALSKIDNNIWELNVIGQGEMLEKYEHLVNELKLQKQVHFLGAYPKSEVFKFMEKTDIFCMPSINETLGLVYLEAMSKGCITIGTKNEGIDGIIKDGYNGFLTECSEEYLSKLITKIIHEDHTKRTIIANNAIKTAKKFNEKDMSKKYLNLVREVIENEN